MPSHQLSQQSNISDITMDDFQPSLSIKDFCDKHNILWFPIVLEIKQNNEDPNKKEKVLKPIKNECYAHAKKTKEGKEYKSYKPEPTDFDNLPIETIKQRQEFITMSDWIAIDTRFIHQIDIDYSEYDEGYDKLMEVSPYFKSATKGLPHIFIKQDGFTPQSARIQLKNGGIKPDLKKNEEGVELLCGQWSYARWNDEMINGDIPPFEISNIETMFLSEADKKPKKVNKTLKTKRYLDEVKTPVDIESKQHIELSENDKIFIRKCENIDVKCINQYGDWVKIIWAIRSVNQELKHIALELTKKSHYYKTDDYFEDHWDKYDDKGLTEGTINYYSKLSNREEYFKIISEQLNYECDTDNSLAEVFIALYGDNFIFCDKKLYYYNGVYWELNESKNILRNQISKYLTREYNKKVSETYKILSEIDQQDETLCSKYKKKIFPFIKE